MNIIIMGPPGVGKGTQSYTLVQRLGMVHISTGDILRMAVRSGTELGQKVYEIMTAGDLVSDELMMELVKDRISQDDVMESGWLLDGFPRTAYQASAFLALLDELGQKVDQVLVLDAPAKEIVRRLEGRITCRVCNETMNLTGFGSVKPVFCPFCGCAQDADRSKPALYQRADDKEDTIRYRLEVFRKKTLPAAWLLEEKYPLTEIDGMGTPDEVFQRISSVLG